MSKFKVKVKLKGKKAKIFTDVIIDSEVAHSTIPINIANKIGAWDNNELKIITDADGAIKTKKVVVAHTYFENYTDDTPLCIPFLLEKENNNENNSIDKEINDIPVIWKGILDLLNINLPSIENNTNSNEAAKELNCSCLKAKA